MRIHVGADVATGLRKVIKAASGAARKSRAGASAAKPKALN
jgi:hypothetical protein